MNEYSAAVAGNARAERFWEKMGYVEVRKRLAVPMGAKVNDLRVLVKPLAGILRDGAVSSFSE